MNRLKTTALEYYRQHEARMDIAFFLAGFLFDIFTLSDIDDPLNIAQQIFYLLITGSILYWEFLLPLGLVQVHPKLQKIWDYRRLIFHFILGSLLSIYSLFFLKSSSFFSSMIFVVILMGLMIANEVKRVQKGEVNIKIALYVICVFSFFSMIFPVFLGFVGLLPFILAMLATAASLYGFYRLLLNKAQNKSLLFRRLLAPGTSVIVLFLLFYLIGWIPPVPLSVQSMGVYHYIEKVDGSYTLSHQNPWWRFWQTGDQEFLAEPGDKIYFFARIFSPAKFSDSVILHWYFKHPKLGWQSTDKVAMQINGGRQGGYRGFSVKQNYQPGEWKIGVETTDEREIGRLYFTVQSVPLSNNRKFLHENY